MARRINVALAVAGLIGAGVFARSALVRADETAGKPSHVSGAVAAAAIGEPAPDFALKDTYGKEFKLSEFKGKIVVLEWLNPDCPVSRGCHEKKTMQDTYKKLAEKAVWLGIDTTDGAQPEKDRVYAAQMQLAYPVLMDVNGSVGHSYGAKHTPHMFVIDKAGKLAYAGAIDDHGTTNYVADAVSALIEGKPVVKPRTEAYGCGVHYPRGK